MKRRLRRRCKADSWAERLWTFIPRRPPAADNLLFRVEGRGGTPHFVYAAHCGVTRQSPAYLFRAAWRNIERVFSGKESPRDVVT